MKVPDFGFPGEKRRRFIDDYEEVNFRPSPDKYVAVQESIFSGEELYLILYGFGGNISDKYHGRYYKNPLEILAIVYSICPELTHVSNSQSNEDGPAN